MIQSQKHLTLVRTLPIENSKEEALLTKVILEKGTCEVDANVKSVVARTDAIETISEDNHTSEENGSETDSVEALKEDKVATVQNILSVCMESAIERSEESCSNNTPKNDLMNSVT